MPRYHPFHIRNAADDQLDPALGLLRFLPSKGVGAVAPELAGVSIQPHVDSKRTIGSQPYEEGNSAGPGQEPTASRPATEASHHVTADL